MDISSANAEPMVALLEFHNQFNRSIKVAFGALSAVQVRVASDGEDAPTLIELPAGGEPWGRTRWRDLYNPRKEAARFITEMGVVRASTAFDDYLVQVEAELNRDQDFREDSGKKAGKKEKPSDTEGDCADRTSSLDRVAVRLDMDLGSLSAVRTIVDFFELARNCIVHRSRCAADARGRETECEVLTV